MQSWKTLLTPEIRSSNPAIGKNYNVSPFPRDVEVRRSDVAMNPFIFLLKNNGQSILFISILGVD